MNINSPDTCSRKSVACYTIVLLPMLASLFFATGCIPSSATKTVRPEINTKPWIEKKIRNTTSGNVYPYMYLPGPSPDAPVAILLHGGIFDNRIWLHCNDLSKKYTVFAPQYPDNNLFYTGHVADWGKVVKDFIDAAQLSPDLIVGVSNGAYGAISYLVQNKTSVKGLVLISTVMLSSSEKEIKKRTRMAKLALRLAPGKLQGLIESRVMDNDYSPTPGSVTQKDIFYIRPYPYYYQLFRVPINQYNKKQNTQKIKVPVLVLHGSEDDIMPLWAAKNTLSAFPNATLKSFDGQGHDMTFAIGPNIAKEILDFFPK